MPGIGLVVGGDSLIGQSIVAALRRAGQPAYFTTRRSNQDGIAFDLSKPDLSIFKNLRFDFAVFCAAVTSMAACEASPDLTGKVNVTGTLAAMRAASDAGAHIVFLSSSQVFDGETLLVPENASRVPKNVYGRHKLEVETAIEREKIPTSILRVTKILANQPVGMFANWYQSLAQGNPAVAATNMTLAPVSAQAAADVAIRLGDERRSGIWHLSSSDEVPYYDAALKMAVDCGFPQHLVRGEQVTEQQVPNIFRHRYAALNTEKLSNVPGVLIKSATDTLIELFAEFPGNSLPRAT
jgi:dTDP-4-dehydrorhamnose reductase